jgi:hypothetical protein
VQNDTHVEAAMLVTNIEISHYSYDALAARHQANVAMTMQDKVVNMYCQLDLPMGEAQRTRNLAFIGEATRQLRRIPEFRSGKQELRFSEALLPQYA